MAASLRFLEWVPPLAIVVLAVLLFCWASGLARPDWFTQIERTQAGLIAAKDGEICADLGFATGSPDRVKCDRDLMDVREHDRRVNTF